MIPDGVTSIGFSAFFDCFGLTSVTISGSVTNIGSYAFNGCGSLTSFTIPDSVTSIGSSAFGWCYKLIIVTFGTNITSIGDEAFKGCSSLAGVTIGANVTSIGDSAFIYCTCLTAITVDTNNPVYSSVVGVLFNHSQTTLIEYPGDKAGNYTIPNSVTSIADYAFGGCSNLTSVTIPNSVTSIADEAFEDCFSLTNVTIGASVTNIADYAFDWCSSLASIYFQGNAPSVDYTVFSNDNNATVYYLPGTTGWAAFSAITGLTTVELTNPALAITAPMIGLQVSNANYTITGTTADTVPVTNVFYALNNSGWKPATTANHWTNWSAKVTLIPGTNTIAAYAVGKNGKFSLTNRVSLDYVLYAVLTVRTNGHGTISPNYNRGQVADWSTLHDDGDGFGGLWVYGLDGQQHHQRADAVLGDGLQPHLHGQLCGRDEPHPDHYRAGFRPALEQHGVHRDRQGQGQLAGEQRGLPDQWRSLEQRGHSQWLDQLDGGGEFGSGNKHDFRLRH